MKVSILIFYKMEVLDLLITGRSISRPTSSRSLNPSISGMWTSLIMISNSFLFSLSRDNASSARSRLVTEEKTPENVFTNYHM